MSVYNIKTITSQSGTGAFQNGTLRNASSSVLSSSQGFAQSQSGYPNGAVNLGTASPSNPPSAGLVGSKALRLALQTLPNKGSPSHSASTTAGLHRPLGMSPDSYLAKFYSIGYENRTYNSSEYTTYAPAPILLEECILWDPSCKTNLTKEQAAEGFWKTNGTMWKLLQDPCFDNSNLTINCTSSLLVPASSSLSARVKSYMRQPACTSDLIWYQQTVNTSRLSSQTTTLTDETEPQTVHWDWGATSAYPPGLTTVAQAAPPLMKECCGKCMLSGPNVEVFFWPEPDADDSCLLIIGDHVNPLRQGASTDDHGDVWWGTVTNSYDIYVGTHTTARIVTVNGIEVKQALVNPWDDGDGTGMPTVTTTRPISSTQSQDTSTITPAPRTVRALPRPIRRAPSSLNDTLPKNGSLQESIIVNNGFTFTSPTIYVAFTSLEASDGCGLRGIGTIPTTTLAFSPGELSTVEGHLLGPHYSSPGPSATKVFNFADLPCPPQSVMEADWCKPAPGEPYRPLLAFPSKLRSLDPWWEDCTDTYWFTGLDPPKVLEGATRLAAEPATGPQQAGPGQLESIQPHRIEPADNAASPTDIPVCPDCLNPGVKGAATPEFLVPPSSPAPSRDSPPPPAAIPPQNPAAPDKASASENASPSLSFQFDLSEQQTDPNNVGPEALSRLCEALLPTSTVANLEPGSEPQSQPQMEEQQRPQTEPQRQTVNQPPSQPQAQPQAQYEPQAPHEPEPQAGSQAQPGSQLEPQSQPQAGEPEVQPVAADSKPRIQKPPVGSTLSEETYGQSQSYGPPPDQSSDASNPAPQSDKIVLGSSTYQIPRVTAQPAPVANGQPTAKIPNGKQQAGDTPPSPGGPRSIVEGSTVEPDQQGAPVIDGKTDETQPHAATSIVSGHTIINKGASGVQVDGVDVAMGTASPAQVGGTPIEINEQGNPVICGQTFAQLPTGVFTEVAGHTFINSENEFAVDGQQLTQGAAPVIVGDTTAYIVDNPSISSAGPPGIRLPAATPSTVTTLPNGQTVKASNDGYEVQGQPLAQGGPPVDYIWLHILSRTLEQCLHQQPSLPTS